MTHRSLVIDTDTASDDAVALLQALRHPGTSVRAITVVVGNVPLTTGVRNALATLELADAREVPVHPGCATPLVRPLETAQHVHGADGMSGADLPDPCSEPRRRHGVEELLAIVRDEPGVHDLVTLGPLTNVATALQIDPLLLTRFRHTWMMLGASDGRGNVSPAGEFNAWADPEAAGVVVAAPGAKTMIGWDVSRTRAVMSADDDRRLREIGRLGAFASRINAQVLAFATEVSGVAGYDLPDPVAMAVALDPGLIRSAVDLHVAVSRDEPTRGQTYADHRLPAWPPNVRVVTDIDEVGFKEQLFGLLDEERQA